MRNVKSGIDVVETLKGWGAVKGLKRCANFAYLQLRIFMRDEDVREKEKKQKTPPQSRRHHLADSDVADEFDSPEWTGGCAGYL
jgi:hypothetical protein